MLKRLSLCILFFLIYQLSGAQNYNAQVIEYNTNSRVVDQELIVTTQIKLQVNNRAGDHHGSFMIPYSKNDKLQDLSAFITDTSGNLIRQLKKDDIVDRSAYTNGLYSDNFVKIFQLKHNAYPYVVNCSFTINYKYFISIAQWDAVIDRSIPTLHSTLQVSIPKDYRVSIKNILIGEPKIIETDEQRTYVWESNYIKPVKEENFSCFEESVPHVSVVPVSFKYWFPGDQSTWQSFGDWIYNLGDGLDVLPESEKIEINRLIAGLIDKKEIARKLYHYLQDRTRYVNVTIGVGGLKPYPAEYVSSNKYGDCKALTNYMKALLRYAGINSYYTVIYADDMPGTIHEDIVYNQFNHAILAVPLDGDTLWLENTNKDIPFNYLGTFTQGRKALVIDKGKSKLIKTPALNKNQVCETEFFKYDIAEDHSATLELNGKYRGTNYGRLNSIYSNLNKEDQDKKIRDMMPFENYEVLNWNLIKADRDSAFISLQVNMRLNKFMHSLGNEYYFTPKPIPIPQFIKPVNRTLPVVIPFPIVYRDSMNFNLPEGLTLKSTPDPVIITSEFGSYKITVTSETSKVIVNKSFALNPGNYSTEQYPELYKFIESAKKADQQKIVVKPLTL